MPQAASPEKTVLHVGCGPANPEKLPTMFRGADWREVRFDIDPDVKPDLIGTMTDMSAVATESVDALYSSHNVEHLRLHEVIPAFREFFRVIRPGGFALVTCPDIQAVAVLIAEGKLEEPAYTAPAGSITALDILYGFSPSIARGNDYMAHRTGYTNRTLGEKLHSVGFAPVRVSKGQCFDLWARADKPNPAAKPAPAAAPAPASG